MYKIELEGGKYNGGEKYYKSYKRALNAAFNYVNSNELDDRARVYIYVMTANYNKILVNLIEE